MGYKKFIGVLLTCFTTSVFAVEEYTFGVVPQYDGRKTLLIWEPVIKEIEKNSSIKLNIVISDNIPDFEKSFLKGEYDFAYMNPYHAIVAHRAGKYKPIVKDIGRIKGVRAL